MLKSFLTFLFASFLFISPHALQRSVEVIKIEGAINPVSAEFIINSIENAEKVKAECLIIELDTPGGLMKSMKLIIKKDYPIYL